MSIQFYSFSLQKKIKFLILSVILVATILLTLPRFLISRNTALDDFEKSIHTHIKLTAFSMSNSIWNYDTDTIKVISDSILLDPKVYSLDVLTLDNMPLYAAKRATNSQNLNYLIDLDQVITFKNQSIANLLITYDNSALHESQRESIIWTIISTLLILFILERLIHFISIKISTPVVDLKNYAVKVSQGQWDTDLQIKSHDEIGELIHAIHSLIESLKSNILEKKQALIALEEININLELKVQERTQELFEINQNLTEINLKLESTVEELYSTQEKLVETEKYNMLSQFILNLAHDLNTPIGLILSSTSYVTQNNSMLKQSLKGTDSSFKIQIHELLEQNEKALEITHNNLQKTIKFMEQFKRIEVKNEIVKKERIYLADFFAMIFKKVKALHKSECIDFRYKCTHEPPVSDHDLEVYFSKYHFEKIFNELINNAVKHALIEDQLLEIQVECHLSENQLSVYFRDNGMGMEDEIKEIIFKPYFTLNAMQMKKKPLGLYIIHNIIRYQFNGTIELIETSQNNGSCFLIRLPIDFNSEKNKEITL